MILGIVLAAGSSKRFGSDKRWLEVQDQEPMALSSAKRLKPHVDRIRVALRSEDQDLAQRFRGAGIPVHCCASSSIGMGSTLAETVRAVIAEGLRPQGLLIALGDMPFIEEKSYIAVRQHLEKGVSMVRPFYEGSPGHPVGLHARWLDALTALSDDEAARHLLRSHSEELCRLEVDDPGVVTDIDTPRDLVLGAQRFTQKEML